MTRGMNDDARVRGRFRRTLMAAAMATTAGAAFHGPGARAQTPAAAVQQPLPRGLPPIVFVHGNGDSAALWQTIIWRFESNGYPAALLRAIDFTRPLARADDNVAQDNRSSTSDQAVELAGFVTRALLDSGQDKAVLIASSRGGNAVRNYVKNGGGHATTALAILAGTPNHGVYIRPTRNPNGEFNGAASFLAGLNAISEVDPRVPFATLRSDRLDKFAQPTGEFVGAPGEPTGIDADGPALRGADNIVLPGRDHREVAFHRDAFRAQWKRVTGREPAALDIVPEQRPVLNGRISGHINGGQTNLPLAGATVRVFKVDASGARSGEPVHEVVTGPDGAWGPFATEPGTRHEFEVTAPGYPVTHVFREPFPRSSRYVHIRLAPQAEADRRIGQPTVILDRPRGYLGHGRDTFTIDGAVPDGINTGVPGTSSGRRAFAEAGRPVVVTLNGATLNVRTFAADQVVIAEFHD